jgi:flagellar hook-associated protein 2
VRNQLDQLVRSAGGSTEALANAGLSIDTNGRLKLDSGILNAAINANPDAVTKVFTNEGRGLADALGSRLESLGGERGVVSRALAQADREVDTLQTRKSAMAQMLTVQAQALVRLYTQDEQLGGASSLFDLFA